MKFSSYVKLKEQNAGQATTAPAQAQGQQQQPPKPQPAQPAQQAQQAQQGQQAPPVDPATALKTLAANAKGNKAVITMLKGIGSLLGIQ